MIVYKIYLSMLYTLKSPLNLDLDSFEINQGIRQLEINHYALINNGFNFG